MFTHLRRVESRAWPRSVVRDIAIRTLSIGGMGGRLLRLLSHDDGQCDAKYSSLIGPSSPLGPRVLVFAHFDASDQLSAADEYALLAYRSTGYSIVVVSTSRNWPQDKEHLADAVIVRPNVGFDFGSWAAAIRILLPRDSRTSLEHLVLVNNSMYGPLWPVEELFARARQGVDVVGLTHSREFTDHLQSYFLSFRGDVLTSAVFDAFWAQPFDSTNKWHVIIRGELAWERHFRSSGFSTGYLIPPRSRVRRNELTFFWAELIEAGLPYVKKSLFSANYDSLDMRDWRETLSALAPSFDTTLIERDHTR